jgi:hypothetical protein
MAITSTPANRRAARRARFIVASCPFDPSDQGAHNERTLRLVGDSYHCITPHMGDAGNTCDGYKNGDSLALPKSRVPCWIRLLVPRVWRLPRALVWAGNAASGETSREGCTENDSDGQAVGERGAEVLMWSEGVSESSVSAVAIACVSVSARPASHIAANSGALIWLRAASKT